MKKICFVTTGDIRNIATSKRALGLANPLLDLGWDVSILMEDAEGNRERVELECDNRIHLYYFPKCEALREAREKSRLVDMIDPDYLYICAFVVRNMVGVRHRSKKLVEHSELLSRVSDLSIWRRSLSYCTEYLSLFYGDALLNASCYLQWLYGKRARRLNRNIPMLYFPYAYNPSVVRIEDVDFDDVRFKRLRDYRVFLFLGSVVQNYGVFTMIEAVRILSQRCGGFQLLIVGRGGDYDKALEVVRRYGLDDYISMPGFVDECEISSYLSLASAFISPMQDTIQDWARCPSKLYIYLPYQKPIITCHIGEPQRVLQTHGYYYTPNDANDLADAMQRVLREQLKRVDVDPLAHTWQRRAEELDRWIKDINLYSI